MKGTVICPACGKQLGQYELLFPTWSDANLLTARLRVACPYCGAKFHLSASSFGGGKGDKPVMLTLE